MKRAPHRVTVGYLLLVASLFGVGQVVDSAGHSSVADWLAVLFFVLLLPAVVPVIALAAIPWVLLGGFLGTGGDVVIPLAMLASVAGNAVLLELVLRRHVAPPAAPTAASRANAHGAEHAPRP